MAETSWLARVDDDAWFELSRRQDQLRRTLWRRLEHALTRGREPIAGSGARSASAKKQSVLLDRDAEPSTAAAQGPRERHFGCYAEAGAAGAGTLVERLRLRAEADATVLLCGKPYGRRHCAAHRGGRDGGDHSASS